MNKKKKKSVFVTVIYYILELKNKNEDNFNIQNHLLSTQKYLRAIKLNIYCAPTQNYK